MSKIESIALYELVCVRPAVVAPNAGSGIRPAEWTEQVLAISTSSGACGLANWTQMQCDNPQRDLGALVGDDPCAMFDWVDSMVRSVAPERAASLARFPAIEAAMLDLCAQERGVPLWSLLGTSVRSTVPVYDTSIYFEDLLDEHTGIADVVARCRQSVASGHRSLKLKVGRGFQWMPWPECTERDVDVCRAVREAVGPEVKLLLDGNRGFSGYVEDAADFLAETSDLKFGFAEELVQDDEVAELRRALKSAGTSGILAGGESIETAAEMDRYSLSVAPDVIQPDLARIGLLQARGLAVLAAERGQSLSPHSFGSQLSYYHALHLGKVTPNFVAAQMEPLKLTSFHANGFHIVDGCVSLSEGPGLGVTLADSPMQSAA